MAKTGKHQQKIGIGRPHLSTRYPNVICYGTFDLFHFGHARLLKRASNLGEKLIIGLSTDGFNKKKGKASVQTYKQRKEVLEMIDCVDMVIPEKNWKQKGKDMMLFRARMVMGSDWKGRFDEYECIYLPRTRNISSTKLKQTL
jgi:glycerol-3-phosphate cytidylyltransferase